VSPLHIAQQPVSPRAAQLSLKSLQLRLARVVLAGAVLFGLGAAALAYRLGQERAEVAGLATLAELAAVVENTAAAGVFAADEGLLNEAIGSLATNPLVARVAILTPTGKTLAAHGREPDTPLTVERPLRSAADRAELIGKLRIAANPETMAASARSQGLTLALWMVGQVLVVALLIGLAVSKLVSRPIVAMARQLSTLQPGTDEQLPLPPEHTHDEIGTLVRSANTLLANHSQALRNERELRAAVQAMEAQYRQIFDSTSAGIFVLAPDGRLINSNPTVMKVLGCSPEQMRLLREGDFIEAVFAQPARVRLMVQAARERAQTQTADLELRALDGRLRWVHCLISVQAAPAGQVPLLEGVIYDVTERKHHEQAVRHRAEHDALTGLKNRAASEAAIERWLQQAHEPGGAVTLMYIDLDGFKHVNDTHGHAAGDQVLRACGQRLMAAVRRNSDLVGRLGGDEFVVALPDTGPGDLAVARLAEGILRSVCQPLALADGSVVQVGASIGLACAPHHGNTRVQLEQAADRAMYEVKRHGKNAFAMAR
jgi:diguanylate cyclase (GGDEF)-like protein/PAS domain S-box-containing protein